MTLPIDVQVPTISAGQLPLLTIEVRGTPVAQGSMSAYVRGGHAVVTDQKRSRLKPWREAVRSTAVDVAGPNWTPIPREQPLRVRIWVALPRPASAPKRRRTWPVGHQSGDVDKLARAILDALTDAGIWTDDSQVTELHITKDYPAHLRASAPGATVCIFSVSGGTPA
jgi:Holliday junction resolvase RusA-like endonuclease